MSNTETRRAASRAWKKANPERHAELNRAYAKRHRDRVKASDAAYRAANAAKISSYRRHMLYGVTNDQVAVMLTAQGNVCACCGGSRPRARNWHVDHDHNTGKIRGILCGPCNAGLGSLGDDVAGVECALAYLKRVASQ